MITGNVDSRLFLACLRLVCSLNCLQVCNVDGRIGRLQGTQRGCGCSGGASGGLKRRESHLLTYLSPSLECFVRVYAVNPRPRRLHVHPNPILIETGTLVPCGGGV